MHIYIYTYIHIYGPSKRQMVGCALPVQAGRQPHVVDVHSDGLVLSLVVKPTSTDQGTPLSRVPQTWIQGSVENLRDTGFWYALRA